MPNVDDETSLTIERRLPTVAEYNSLRKLVGWPVFDEHVVQKGLTNSLFSVCVLDPAGKLLGFGRIIGDGAIYFHIQDVIVHPEHQRLGVGKQIMRELLQYTDEVGTKKSMVGLMSSMGREKFYADLGFAFRPNEKAGAGMTKVND
jgi:ribosomal protein S18 acetylase RimI-like enzyme